jgi:hypothetical protein
MSDSLDRAREQRTGLRVALGDVEQALSAPAPRREVEWRGDLGVALDALSNALESHIASTEAADGLLAEIMSAAPRLAHRIDRVRADHERLRSDLGASRGAVETGEDVDVIRDRVIALLADLVRHRQLGSDLVYDAYNVDIEAGD